MDLQAALAFTLWLACTRFASGPRYSTNSAELPAAYGWTWLTSFTRRAVHKPSEPLRLSSPRRSGLPERVNVSQCLRTPLTKRRRGS